MTTNLKWNFFAEFLHFFHGLLNYFKEANVNQDAKVFPQKKKRILSYLKEKPFKIPTKQVQNEILFEIPKCLIGLNIKKMKLTFKCISLYICKVNSWHYKSKNQENGVKL